MDFKANHVVDALSRVNAVQSPNGQPPFPPGPQCVGVEEGDLNLQEFPPLFHQFCGAITTTTAANLPALAVAQAADASIQEFFARHGKKVKLELVGLPNSPA